MADYVRKLGGQKKLENVAVKHKADNKSMVRDYQSLLPTLYLSPQSLTNKKNRSSLRIEIIQSLTHAVVG